MRKALAPILIIAILGTLALVTLPVAITMPNLAAFSKLACYSYVTISSFDTNFLGILNYKFISKVLILISYGNNL